MFTMASETNLELSIKKHIQTEWPTFREYYKRIVSKYERGGRLHEKDIEIIFQSLAEGPLGYEIEQLSTQSEYADYALVDRGLKLAIVEIKSFRAFASKQEQSQLESALIQAARYAHRHRTPHLMAFDGLILTLAELEGVQDVIKVHIQANIEADEPPEDLFYFTHYGLFCHPTEELFTLPYDADEDASLYKTHHGVKLHYSCFAYVGDIRDKETWRAPYRNPDGSVDVKRIGHAVNYLLSPSGHRGKQASRQRIPEAATPLVAIRLAKAYKEIGKWDKPDTLFGVGKKPNPQHLLWTYLYQNGLEENV
jgi:hypothetical protein